MVLDDPQIIRSDVQVKKGVICRWGVYDKCVKRNLFICGIDHFVKYFLFVYLYIGETLY